jgi:hypothetical protein
MTPSVTSSARKVQDLWLVCLPFMMTTPCRTRDDPDLLRESSLCVGVVIMVRRFARNFRESSHNFRYERSTT